jgi:hypothetical protein
VDGNLALTRYSRSRWTAFQTPNPEDWLEVDFGEPREVGRVELFLYGDGRGVAAPEEYWVQLWTGEGWRTVTPSNRIPAAPLAWAVNRTEFEQERTERIRVVFRHAGPLASGVAEIRVFP